MAKEETDYRGSEPGQDQVTIEVTARSGRRPLKDLLRGGRVRVGLALIGLVAAAAAATITVASPGTRPSRAVARSPGTRLGDPDAVATRFGIRLHCLRLTIVSPDRTYARADFDRAMPCGSYGNYVTIVLHRVHRTWVRELEATGWRCPTSWLPRSVLAELQLCRSIVMPRRPVAHLG